MDPGGKQVASLKSCRKSRQRYLFRRLLHIYSEPETSHNDTCPTLRALGPFLSLSLSSLRSKYQSSQ